MSKSKYSDITTLKGMSEEELKEFSWNNLKHFYRVTLYERDNKCAICYEPIESIKKATLDHIVPRHYGGRTRLSNLQLTHERCNSVKSSKLEGVSFNLKAMTPRTRQITRLKH